MAVHLTGLTCDDVAEVVDSLLDAADACEPHAPRLAEKRRCLAEQLGDALDVLPKPTDQEELETI
ncbi:hypothetical protein [Streptomyces wuyuanensis]|uniref:hypothetical protein n=1 Tax=Streptomyces wuyuanensis TaxID=1196353 RepID=UPI0037909E1F